MTRNEVKYSCCPNKYTLLQLTLFLRRKPLFYLVNLIIPTSIITLIAIVGFFTTSSASGMREEKVSLGITTLLSMSILMLMVSDQMPTTSTFIPLIGKGFICQKPKRVQVGSFWRWSSWFPWGPLFLLSSLPFKREVLLANGFLVAFSGKRRAQLEFQMTGFRVAKIIAYVTCTALPPHIEKEHQMVCEGKTSSYEHNDSEPFRNSFRSLVSLEDAQFRRSTCSVKWWKRVRSDGFFRMRMKKERQWEYSLNAHLITNFDRLST